MPFPKKFTKAELRAKSTCPKCGRVFAMRTSTGGGTTDYQDTKGHHWHYEGGKAVSDG